MKSNEMNSQLEAIGERYSSDSAAQRFRRMIRGLRMPRSSREHKESLIEIQRLSAPLCAVLVPLLAVFLLMALAGRVREQPHYQTISILDDEPPFSFPDDKPEPEFAPRDPLIAERVLEPLEPVLQPVEAPDPVADIDGPVTLVNMPAGPVVGGWKFPGDDGRGERVAVGKGRPTERNVMLALRWLKQNQSPDGSWNRHKSAMTGLAVLTFLAHNEKPGLSPEFGETVLGGLRFLMGTQDLKTGLYGHQDGHQYSHPIAAYAMCEAYGMTLHPSVKESAERALAPIIKGQNPTGGWTYKMNPGLDPVSGGYRDDTSYMGWCVQALKAARMAGLKVDGLDAALKRAVAGFEKNAAPNGGFGYTGPSATHGLTAVGVLCMELLGAGDDSRVRKSFAIMDTWSIGAFDGPNTVGRSPQYYFYYATQSKYNHGGRSWSRWDREMVEVYSRAQKIQRGVYKDHLGESHDIGWWENGDAHTDRPVMDTCLAALQLMVYYRHLPTSTERAFTVEPEIMALLRDPEDIKVREEERL